MPIQQGMGLFTSEKLRQILGDSLTDETGRYIAIIRYRENGKEVREVWVPYSVTEDSLIVHHRFRSAEQGAPPKRELKYIPVNDITGVNVRDLTE